MNVRDEADEAAWRTIVEHVGHRLLGHEQIALAIVPAVALALDPRQ